MTGEPDDPGRWPADGHLCTLCAVDIVGYTRPDRDEETQSHLRHTVNGMVREAFSGSGVPWERCPKQDRGDGLLVIIPPDIPPHVIISAFPERFRQLIRRHNRFATGAARLQVRASLNIGPVYRDEHGYCGEDINLVCRMLEARPLRHQLDSTGTELALIVSASVYDAVLRHLGQFDPATYMQVRARVKWTRITAWIYAPG